MSEQMKIEKPAQAQTPQEAQAARETVQAESRFGKFSDPEQLYRAYRALESEFTKRCQEIKGLKNGLTTSEEENRCLRQKLDCFLEDEQFLQKAAADARVVQAVLKAHLTRRAEQNAESVSLLTGGVGFAAAVPAKCPKTLEEANLLAQRILK